MIVSPNIEIRQEGANPMNPFGREVENPLIALGKELHIHRVGDKTSITLDNPVVGGPFIANSQGKDVILVPGEKYQFDNKNLVIFIKKLDAIQTVFLEANELFS